MRIRIDIVEFSNCQEMYLHSRWMFKRQIKLYEFLEITWNVNRKIIRLHIYPLIEHIACILRIYVDNGQGYSQIKLYTFFINFIYIVKKYVGKCNTLYVRKYYLQIISINSNKLFTNSCFFTYLMNRQYSLRSRSK